MRVISGKYKGRVLEGFELKGTRPTMDRVKESLFATIQNNVKNSVVLDLFAGSGQLGIEAISNGANICYFIDNNKEVIKVLNQNISNLNIKSNLMFFSANSFNDFFQSDKRTLEFCLIFKFDIF